MKAQRGGPGNGGGDVGPHNASGSSDVGYPSVSDAGDWRNASPQHMQPGPPGPMPSFPQGQMAPGQMSQDGMNFEGQGGSQGFGPIMGMMQPVQFNNNGGGMALVPGYQQVGDNGNNQQGGGSGGGPQQQQQPMMYSAGGCMLQPMPQMMMQGMIPNGMVGQNGQPNIPGGMQLVMMAPGQMAQVPMGNNPEWMQQGMPMVPPSGHNPQNMQDGMAVMMAMGMATGPDHGGKGMMDMNMDGKRASRVAALSRNSQPKQGSWHGPERRGSRPQSDFGPSRGFDPQDGPQGMDQSGPMQCSSSSGMPQGKAAGMSISEAITKMRPMRNPQKPWADVQDAPAGYDDDLRMWWPQQQMMAMAKDRGPQFQDSSPRNQMSQGAPPPMNRGKGRKDGKDGKDAGHPGGEDRDQRHRSEWQRGGQKWVVVGQDRPDLSGPKGPGKGPRQESWQEKEPLPKAPLPMQRLPQPAAPPINNLPTPPAKGRGGGKKKSQNDKHLDDWLSLRFAGVSASSQGSPLEPSVTGSVAGDRSDVFSPSGDAGDGKGFSMDDRSIENDRYYDGDDAQSRRHKRKGGKGKGKAAEKRREKGGKGKSFWRASQEG